MQKCGLTLALLAVLGAAACGGHRSPTAPPPPPPTGGGPDSGGTGGTTPPPAPPTLKITRILAFGDSLTEGTVQPPASWAPLDAGLAVSYPYKLQTLENARYTSQTISVFNGGIAGHRAKEDRARLSDDISQTNPDVLLLMEGTNDIGDYVGLSGSALTSGLTTVVNAMEDMVRDTKARGIVPFVATIPAQRAGAQRGGAAAIIDPYNALLKVMIAKKGATLVDVNAQLPLSLIGLDGLHPTEEGYQKMAEIFQGALAAVYEVPPATNTGTLARR
jgi:lysophospholipase L1-like esterase